jgi:hypothetical protein
VGSVGRDGIVCENKQDEDLKSERERKRGEYE